MTVHFDNPKWQDGGSCGPFAGRPVQVRNGIPWKPYRRGHMSALDDRNRWLDHLHDCRICNLTSGFCDAGLDLVAAVEASMAPGETMRHTKREDNSHGTVMVGTDPPAGPGPQGGATRPPDARPGDAR